MIYLVLENHGSEAFYHLVVLLIVQVIILQTDTVASVKRLSELVNRRSPSGPLFRSSERQTIFGLMKYSTG
jgi:hypothetical protein